MLRNIIPFVCILALTLSVVSKAIAGFGIGDQKRTIVFVPCDKKPKPVGCDVKY